MTTLQERIAGERRRLRTVRQKLSAAVAQTAPDAEAWSPFYIAVGDYMEASMARLHAQDDKMGDMIREKADTSEAQVQKALAELADRLNGNHQRLQRLLKARDALRGSPTAANVREFESAARDFTDFIVANMGHHGATTELAAKLFVPADWEFMAGVTDEDMAREVALFDKVTASTPADLQLPVE